MKKLFIFLASLFLIIVLVLAAAYIFRGSLIQSAGPLIADQLGLEIAELELETIGLRRIVIPKFKAKYFSSDKIIDVAVDQLTMRIDPWAGTHEAIKSVSVKNIELTINTSNDHATETDVDARTIDLIRGLPSTIVAVESIALTYQYAAEKVLLYQGSITRDQNQLETSGALLLPGYFHSNIVFMTNLFSSFDLSITSLKPEEDRLEFAGEFTLDDDWIFLTGDGDLNISAVEAYLDNLGLELPVQLKTLNSKFNVELEANLGLPANRVVQSMAAKLDLAAVTQLRVPDVELERVDLDVHTECVIEALSIANCQIQQPINAGIEFTRAPAWVTENFDWSEHQFTAEINPANAVALRVELNEKLSYQASGNMRISVRAQNEPLSVDATITDIALNASNDVWKLDGKLGFQLDAGSLKTPVHAKRAIVSMQGLLQATNKGIDAQILQGAQLIVQHAKSSAIEINKLELVQQGKAGLSYAFDTDLLNGSNLHYVIRPMKLKDENLQLEFSKSHLAIKELQRKKNNWHILARVDANDIEANRANRVMEFHGIGVDLQISGDQIEVLGEVEVGQESAPVKIEGKHHLGEQVGSAVITVDAFSLGRNEVIKAMIATTGLPLQLKQGNLSTQMTASWDNVEPFDPSADIKLRVEGVTGDYAQNQFEGLSTEIQVNGSQRKFFAQPIKVKIDSVNVGVPITDISFGFDRVAREDNEMPVVHLNEFSAKLLDGSIYAKEIELDLNRPVNEFSIYLFNLSLQQLLALNQTEDLVASGRFNGELPMRIQSEDFSIQAGWIKADEQGGVIKYDRIDEVLVGNPNLELVADLLKDFRYNEMSAQIDLQPDGNILLATKLHGRSPNSEFNKQVNLNFNIEFNLWKFLESARLLTRIDQDISEQIISKQRDK